MPSSERASDVTGVVIAGGRSSRMNHREKALVDLGGEPMIGRIIARLRPQVGHLVINANGEPQRFAPFGLPVVADQMEGRQGPLAGLQAGLAWARRETPNVRFVASVAADSPFIPDDLVARLRAALEEAETFSAIAASAGEATPIIGLWSIALADALAGALEDGVRAVHSFAAAQGSAVVEFPFVKVGGESVDPFFNVNTPDDLAKARALLARAAEPARPPLIGIVGWKNSGKTTLIERLVAALTRRRLKVATVKHTHHELRAHDGSTDGERYARAGAIQTAVIGPSQWELTGEVRNAPAPSLEELAQRLGPADLVLVEGYKSAAIAKIEVRRRAATTREGLAPSDERIIAIAADHAIEGNALPVFALDDIEGIAAFVLMAAGLQRT